MATLMTAVAGSGLEFTADQIGAELMRGPAGQP
ncbi:hypothetical protein HD593_003657 [Nonomuraea rubra]|uniref:Uncharacterized protein n=1 Tax=Nonomuraea rubra TaxID=46180 RepID=A0A7X0NSL8_9ACTN|nr:hypothetical protein [Nonomuraea rubra]